MIPLDELHLRIQEMSRRLDTHISMCTNRFLILVGFGTFGISVLGFILVVTRG